MNFKNAIIILLKRCAKIAIYLMAKHITPFCFDKVTNCLFLEFTSTIGILPDIGKKLRGLPLKS